MNYKKLIISLVAMTSSISTVAIAEHRYEDRAFVDYAYVVNSTPVYEYVRVNSPEEQCWNEVVERRSSHRASSNNSANALVGAVIGGVIGNQIGKGKGRKAATAAGVLIGAGVGANAGKHDNHHNRRTTTRVVERQCEIVDHYTEHKELTGYRVKYRYNGQTYSTIMDRDPGRKLKLNVSIAVAE